MKSLTLRRKLLFGVGLIALLALGFVLLIPILQRSTERAFSAEQLKTEEGCAYWADKMDGPVHMQEYNQKMVETRPGFSPCQPTTTPS